MLDHARPHNGVNICLVYTVVANLAANTDLQFIVIILDILLPPTAAVNGQTPVSLACANGHLNVSQYLVEERHCDPKGNLVLSACVPVCTNTDETLFSSRTLGIVITSNNTFVLHYRCIAVGHKYLSCTY